MAVAAASTKYSNLVPQQDSNLRSRLRRPMLYDVPTWRNAPFPSGWGAYGERRMRTAGPGCTHIFDQRQGRGARASWSAAWGSTHTGAVKSQQHDDADRLAAVGTVEVGA